jgi:phenylacetate-CoA ligase
MNTLLKRLYDLAPQPVQDALIAAFSTRLEKQRYGGKYPEFRNLLEDSEWWDRQRMGEYQDERLRAIVRHAYEHVPYYRELFDKHGIDAQKFRGREDLPKIPLLTRETIKRRTADLRSRRPEDRNLAEGHTSGTTGSPLTILYGGDVVPMTYAVLDRQYRWAGTLLARGGDRVAIARGNVIVPLSQKRPPFWRQNRSMNHLLLSSFHLTTENIASYHQALRDFDPVALDGYPSSLYVLAKVLLNKNETLPLKAAITSSETLFDFQRETIETAFQCRVFDYYGAAERVVFAAECDHHQGHHLCEEYGVTEILGDDGEVLAPGNEGIMVGTSLHNLGMPMIRYRTSDRSALKTHSCGCGRPLPLMEDVTTKAEDLLRLKDGRLIPPSVLTHPFKPLDCIEASQIVQTDLDRIVVRLIPRPDYTETHGAVLIRDLKARLGADMRVDIELLQEMPRTSRGKFKWVISQVELGI